jgi:hypothetical protein
MALRVRSSGEVVCAAQTYEQPGDFYVPDGIHGALHDYFTKLDSEPESDEDRAWAELFGRCMETGDDPRWHWPKSSVARKD